jgi:hypothetical protein
MEGFDLGSIVAHIKADTREFTAGLEQAKTEANNFAGKMASIAAGTAAVVDALVIGFGIHAVKAFSESEDAIAQTNAVLKSTAGIAGVTADQVTKLSKAWENQSKYSDEAVRGAENILLTFTNISKDIFPQTTQAVLDISTALHEDLQSASIQVGKALQDPVLGITALRRVGVNFTEAQRNVIKSLVETGQSAKAQQIILAELNREFGGSAKAAGDTLSGAMAKLKNRFNDFEELVGGKIISTLTTLFHWYERHARIVNDVAGVLGTLVGILAVALVLYGNWILLTKTLAAAQLALNLIMDMNPIVLAIMAIVVVAALVLEHWKQVKQWFFDFWNFVKAIFADISNFISGILNGIHSAIKAYINLYISAFNDVKKGILAIFNGAINWLYDVGKDIIQGLINGIKAMAGAAENAAKDIGKGITSGAKKILGVLSPSTVFHEIGTNVGEGLVNGINAMQSAVSGASIQMAMAAVAPSSSVVNNAQTNNQSSVSTSIGVVNIGSNADSSRFLKNLTRNQELAVKGLTPVR